MIDIFSINFDEVIKSRYITAATDYEYALNYLVPLINRLDIQRNIQDSKFYTRLEKDLVKGCIMPAITLAFVDNTGAAVKIEDKIILEKYLKENIGEGFILDGIQRLNTLLRTYNKNGDQLKLDRVLFLNIVICSSMDNLLYRMITLNNGQKPMSARHQIEILTTNLYEFENDAQIYTEREVKKLKVKVAFNKADFIKGYLGFLANSTNIENQKIIEAKLDDLIADKILDSNIPEGDFEFTEAVNLINRLSKNEYNYKWFKNSNNLLGFCVGIKSSFSDVSKTSNEDFENSIRTFEEAFDAFNYSKIKIGNLRKKLANYFISNFYKLKNKEINDLTDILSEVD